MNTVLIVGGGGREHALLKALLRSERALCMYAYPGNPGMEANGCAAVDRKIENWEQLADWVEQNQIDLTVVGPEVPLVEGIVDVFAKRRLPIFGPSQKAARIEGSKAFAKDLMKKYGIPTAAFEVFENKKAALAYLKKQGAPIVVKVSGLAAGKGAIVCDTEEQAVAALEEVFDRKSFGEAGSRVVLEEKMVGEEASVFALTDGKTHRLLPVSQDHKAIGDGDTGPNTGGMGAYAPAPLVDDALLARIDRTIMAPTLDALRKEESTYRGLLYCGIMVTSEGPKVVEFNCRFGDPETQAVLPLVQCDWYDVLRACCEGTLDRTKWSVRQGYCVTVVLASGGYPGAYEKGKLIRGIDAAERSRPDVDVYHAGTARKDNALVTNGGRVLAVSAAENTLHGAIKAAYAAVDRIDFDGKTYRTDIAAKGVARLKNVKSLKEG
jgi:phosphoribosylamine--glycine ligase